MPSTLKRRPQTLPRELVERKRQFRIALASAGLTGAEWARKHGLYPSYLSRYLAGQTTSAPLTEKVNAFIAKHLPAKVA